MSCFIGLFMALQPRLIACGATLATFAMAIRFLTGPAVMAATSIAVGLRGVDLHAAIVQVNHPICMYTYVCTPVDMCACMNGCTYLYASIYGCMCGCTYL